MCLFVIFLSGKFFQKRSQFPVIKWDDMNRANSVSTIVKTFISSNIFLSQKLSQKPSPHHPDIRLERDWWVTTQLRTWTWYSKVIQSMQMQTMLQNLSLVGGTISLWLTFQHIYWKEINNQYFFLILCYAYMGIIHIHIMDPFKTGPLVCYITKESCQQAIWQMTSVRYIL